MDRICQRDDCNNDISHMYIKAKYCSKRCAAIVNNKKRAKGKKCEYCGKERKRYDAKYCSVKCHTDSMHDAYIKRWKAGKEKGYSGRGTSITISAYIRTYLFDKHDSKCELCGWGEVNVHSGKIPLEIHHIDGNSINNNESNLQLLCPNCHSLTKTYGILNKGNGRGHR